MRLKDDSGLFGDLIFAYTDDQAIEDGVLIPLRFNRRDTRHRVTRNAYEALKTYHRDDYDRLGSDHNFRRYLLGELLPLVSCAAQRWCERSILKTDYDFRVTNEADRVLWYVPNEVGGITMMKPEDY